MVNASIVMSFKGGLELHLRVRRDSTPTVKRLLESMPFDSVAQRWGDEVYFTVPFHADLEPDARTEMEVGEVGFWPDGDALAIFFGRTPSSVDDRPRAYSPCNIVGRVEGDSGLLRAVRPGARVDVLER